MGGQFPFRIVGVVGNVRTGGIQIDPRPVVYTSISQAVEGFNDDFGMDVVVRIESDDSALVGAVRDQIGVEGIIILEYATVAEVR